MHICTFSAEIPKEFSTRPSAYHGTPADQLACFSGCNGNPVLWFAGEGYPGNSRCSPRSRYVRDCPRTSKAMVRSRQLRTRHGASELAKAAILDRLKVRSAPRCASRRLRPRDLVESGYEYAPLVAPSIVPQKSLHASEQGPTPLNESLK